MKLIYTLPAVIAAGLLVAGISSLSAREYGMAGCGLGSLAIGKNEGQLTAATTNGTLGNQTFGITSGTSNCVGDDVALKQQKQEYFVMVNFESLQHEMAVGKGEKLNSLASLLGCPTDRFGQMTRKEYGNLFPAGVTPESILNSVKVQIARDPALASACRVQS